MDENYATGNEENDISIYRMIQELVNNIMKHAGANIISISSVFKNQKLVIKIDYNGSGLSQLQFEAFRYNKDGLGLKNIQNRIILLKGSILFTALNNQNNIIIDVPVNYFINEKN